MPLSKRARIEIYLPKGPDSVSWRLRRAIESEFLHTFGGCTVIDDTRGLYKGADRRAAADRITLLYADTPFDFDEHFTELSEYTDALRDAVLETVEEESVLIVVHEIYHSL